MGDDDDDSDDWEKKIEEGFYGFIWFFMVSFNYEAYVFMGRSRTKK